MCPNGASTEADAMKNVVDSTTNVSPKSAALGTSPAICGWLEKRYPCPQANWARRWCVLDPTGKLTYYTDRACSLQRGSIGIKGATQMIRFQSPEAPEDAIECQSERPFGFVINDDDVATPEKRRSYYFDAGEESVLKVWMEALEAATGRSPEPTKDTVLLPEAHSSATECQLSHSQVVIKAAYAAALRADTANSPTKRRSRLPLETRTGYVRTRRASDANSPREWDELWLELCKDAEKPADDAAAAQAFSQWRPKENAESRSYWFFWSKAECSELSLAIRGGVARHLRGDMWYTCSDAATKRFEQKTSYLELVEKGRNLGDIEAMRIIEADLPRTGLKEVNQEVLRNVLVAFAAANSQIGYCQSMNFIAATLLSYLEEERCFWTLLSLIEDILPRDYFTSGMAGLRTDLKVLSALIEQHLPKLHEHLQNEGLDLSAITMNWFLCLYLNTLPRRLAHRVLDCLMHEGSEVLFRVALSILQAKEEELLKVTCLPGAYMLLRAPCEAAVSQTEQTVALKADRNAEKVLENDILERMYGSWLDSWSAEELANLRELHLPTVHAEDRDAKALREARAKAREVKARKAKLEEAKAARDRESFSSTRSGSSDGSDKEAEMEPATSLRRSSDALEQKHGQDLHHESQDEEQPGSPMARAWASVVSIPGWLTGTGLDGDEREGRADSSTGSETTEYVTTTEAIEYVTTQLGVTNVMFGTPLFINDTVTEALGQSPSRHT